MELKESTYLISGYTKKLHSRQYVTGKKKKKQKTKSKKQKYRPMEQDRKPREKPTHMDALSLT